MTVYCPACHSQDLELMFNMGYQPMSLVALQDRPGASDALERYPIRLAICNQCSHVHNIDFNPNYTNYTNGCRMFNNGALWQSHMKYVQRRVECMLVDTLIEIGAGDCSFLDAVDTDAVKIAIDPAHASAVAAQELGIHHVREKFCADEHIPEGADEVGIVMRHLLEHMEEPRDFIEEIAIRAQDRADSVRLFIEVPNCELALQRLRIEDWTYEHVQHFTYRSMHKMLEHCGCTDIGVRRSYGDEVLIATGTLWPASRQDTKNIVEGYKRVEQNLEDYSLMMQDGVKDGSVAFWGGAGKSAMFIRMLKLPENALVVDSHDEKWGLYVPGTEIEIQPPCKLREGEPRTVIATTSWRADDIAEEIRTYDYPVKQLLKFENGTLTEVDLGN